MAKRSIFSLGFLFTFLTKFFILVSSTACITSRETAKIVTECPQTQSAWEAAAVNKNCGRMPNPCSSFVYHCVMNTWKNQTIEVCAPKQMILGKNCAEYNFLGAKVQRNSKVKCRKCPIVYNSTDAFRYQECYTRAIPITKPEDTWTLLHIPIAETTNKTENSSSSLQKPEYLVQRQISDDKKSKVFEYISFGGFCVIIAVSCVFLTTRTIFSKRIQVKACSDGYFGINCGYTCPAPYFGRRCTSRCNCSIGQCHHAYGCMTQNDPEIHDDISMRSRMLGNGTSTNQDNGNVAVEYSSNAASGFPIHASVLIVGVRFVNTLI